ncbi:MAG: Hint domain-containing protein [Paracoccaceae bacterium]
MGSQFMLDPNWSESTSGYTLNVDDDDTSFEGNSTTQTDSGQSGMLYNPTGGVAASGPVRLGMAYTAADPAGGTITFYELYVGGTYLGMVSDKPIQPGVTYSVTSAVDGANPDYSSLLSSTYEQSNANDITGGGYADSIEGGAGNDTITAGDGNDTVKSGSGDDLVSGGAGNDNLDGGTGSDTLMGGADADTFKVDEADEATVITGGESGNDNDSLFLSNYQTGGGVNITFTGHEAGNFSYVNTPGSGSFTEIESIGTTNGSDSIDGSATTSGIRVFTYGGNDTVSGGTGADAIYTYEGNDTVTGGAGNDYVSLGDGNDSLGDFGTEDGNDTILGEGGNDFINAGYGDDLVYGGSGDDVIIGALGNDTLHGEDGSDSFYITDDHEGTVVYGGDGGTDQDGIYASNYLSTSGIHYLFTGAEAGTFDFFATPATGTFQQIEVVGGTDYADVFDASANTAALSVYGQAGDDTITGGSANDALYGDGGNDSIVAGTGDDYVIGGFGNDYADLGEGNDAFGDWGTDAGNDTVYGGEGNDWVNGGQGDDILYGDAGDDGLTGAAGSDTMYGGDGNDAFYVTDDHDADQIFGGEGATDWDRVDFNNWATTTGVNVVLGGSETGSYQFVTGTTAGTFSEIEAVTGTAYADSVDGSGATSDSYVEASEGNDTVTGGSGNDYLAGETGNDNLAGGAGNDQVIGGDGNDSLSGGDGSDTINGGAGDDTIDGGTGSDNLWGGTGSDTFVLTDDMGNDWIEDFDITVVDGRSVDQLDVSQMTDIDGNPVTVDDITVSDDGQGNALLSFSGGESLLLRGVAPSQVSTQQMLVSMGVPCFVRGTMIQTAQGEKPVEDLQAGEHVMTRDAGLVPVIWSGARLLDRADLARRPDLRPIILSAGALGQPRALQVSPQHALAVLVGGTEHLVRARHLAELGLHRIHQAKGRQQVSYHHILLPAHALVRANGLWAETFYPGPVALKDLAEDALQRLAQALRGAHDILSGHRAVETAYGPRIRPLLTRRTVLAGSHHFAPLTSAGQGVPSMRGRIAAA